VQRAAFVVVVLTVGLLLVGWLLARRGAAWGTRISLLGGIVARAAGGCVAALSCVRAAERGGVWFSTLAILLGAISLSMFAFAGFFTWALLTRPQMIDGPSGS
jgi:predicted permease